MKNSDLDDPNWDKTRALLREHLTAAPLEHPDFVNSQVLAAIQREERSAESAKPVLFPLRRLVWSGLGLLAAALVFSVVLLPRDFGSRSESEFISQVIEARAEIPQLSVTSFRVPKERGVVLWIEGSDYIPADHPVQ